MYINVPSMSSKKKQEGNPIILKIKSTKQVVLELFGQRSRPDTSGQGRRLTHSILGSESQMTEQHPLFTLTTIFTSV